MSIIRKIDGVLWECIVCLRRTSSRSRNSDVGCLMCGARSVFLKVAKSGGANIKIKKNSSMVDIMADLKNAEIAPDKGVVVNQEALDDLAVLLAIRMETAIEEKKDIFSIPDSLANDIRSAFPNGGYLFMLLLSGI